MTVSDLLNAVYRGDAAGRDAILAERAPVDVFEAAAVGDAARVGALLDEDAGAARAYATDGFTPLHLAVFFGHPEAARLLVARGAEVDAVAANALAVRPLHSAAAGRDGTCLRLLVEAGADVNATQRGGFTALHACAQNGDDEGAVLLLGAGADPLARTADGLTAADLARAAGHLTLADRLATD